MAISGVIDITYSHGSTDATLENFINERFSDYLTASHEVDSAHIYMHIKDVDENEIITIQLYETGGSYTNIKIYNENEEVINNKLANSTKAHWSIYSCTNGLLIRAVNESEQEMWAFITINEDGKIIYGTSPTTSTGASPTSFITTDWTHNAYTTTATSRAASSTSLLNLVYDTEYNQLAIAENAYFALYNQYPYTPGILTINGQEYISNGWFVIAD